MYFMDKKKNFLTDVISFITYKDKNNSKVFHIPEANEVKKAEEKKTENKSNTASDVKRKEVKKPLTVSEFNTGKESEKNKADDTNISTEIEKNMKYMKEKFNFPANKDIVLREFIIAEKHKSFIIYLDGMVDKNIINNFILRPLLKENNFKDINKGCQLDHILTSVLETNQISRINRPDEAVYEILTGNTLVYVDGCNYYISNETKGFPTRGVEKPVVEGVIQGAQEAFNETLRTNITLIRKLIKNPNLTTEFLKIGKRSSLQCAVMYIEGLTNPAIIDEVKRRINNISIDYSQGDGMLEQLIEDNTYSLIPTILTTERPDRAASYIIEGRVAILVEGSPFAKIVPVTIYTFIHSIEDTFMKWPFGTLLRYIRLLGIFFASLLPGLYVAITNFHQEMIPTDLLIAIAKAKENVPFPTIVEVLLMEISFELIREAGIRIPGVIGNTLGIIGALILGQAAVQANIVSPVLIIVVAITGLGNFAVPNPSLALGIRIIRFVYILLGAFLGFYGITVGLLMTGAYMVDQKSFGVPFVAPVAPKTARSGDLIERKPMWMQQRRPDFLNPMDDSRQPEVSRKWRQKEAHISYDRKEKK